MLNLNGAIAPMLPNTKIPRVKGQSEAEKFPTQANTETVLFDETAEDIIYIKVTAQNGFSRTVRYRCYEEPEPTTEDVLKSEFLSKDEFNQFLNEFRDFRKEMTNNAQHTSNNAKPANGKQSPVANG